MYHFRSTVALGIRKVQYAPSKQGRQPCTIVRKDFMLSPGELELEVVLDKQVRLRMIFFLYTFKQKSLILNFYSDIGIKRSYFSFLTFLYTLLIFSRNAVTLLEQKHNVIHIFFPVCMNASFPILRKTRRTIQFNIFLNSKECCLL